MTPDVDRDPSRLPSPLPSLVFPLQVEQFYASLIRQAPSAEAGLGGRLFYVAELDEDGRALMVAANIAGAGSLAATADPITQKQAIREGVADFLVTTLDEALRILKNEIRKGEAVAVCVGAAPEVIEQEMVERGVLPDLVRDIGGVGRLNTGVMFGERTAVLELVGLEKADSLLSWSVDEAPAQWLPRLDAIAMECLVAAKGRSAETARRWLRFAPRYLGRLARNVRVVRCSTVTAETIAERMRAAVRAGEIRVPVRIEFI